MKLTTQDLTRFIGGQIETQNENEGYLFRGEIASAEVDEEQNNLVIICSWFAKGEGFPPFPKRWVRHNSLRYATSLEIYSVSDIGPSGPEVGGGSRLSLNSWITGELTILYPADGSKLDRAKVEGLDPVPA